ncbi:MAG: carbohydrate ABC transporter permease [Thermaceae bacterium]|nr:carbohydrate ABC transporter permease [Thermaceae bacterium]
MNRLRNWYHQGYGLSLLGLLMLIIFLFPIYWMVLTALRPSTLIFAYPPHFLPDVVDLDSLKSVLADPKIPRYFLNSTIVGFGCTFLTLLLAVPAAYALAHLPLRGKSLLLLISLSSLMFPAIMIATPLFVIFSRLGLTDSYFGLIIANTALALPFAITVLRPFYLGIPKQLTEAAKIDGCTTWGAFWRVILPLSQTGLVTTAIFTFLFGWSDLLFAITLVNSDQIRPITAGLYANIGNNSIKWNAVMALSTVAMLPPLVLFLISQRYVIRGLTTGAVKE